MKNLIPMLLIIIISLSSCYPNNEESVATLTVPPSPISYTSTPTPTSTPSPEPTIITNIVMDGQPDDWSDRYFSVSDPLTDGTPGYLEIAAGTVFLNRDAVYFMLEFADPTASFMLFDINFQVDGKPLQITWQPGQLSVVLVDWSSGEGKRLGWTKNSSFAFGSVLEGRIDLDDLGIPGTVAGFSAKVMAEVEGKGWTSVDTFQVEEISSLFEKDSLRMSSSEDKYYYARFWNLPEGYVAENLFQSQIPNNSYIARSEDGTIYAQSWGDKPQVILIDPEHGEAHSILSLPAYVGLGRILGGPGNSALINVEAQVWQIFPDGSYETVGSNEFSFLRNYTPDGRYLAISHDRSTLVEWFTDGSTRMIADGFQGLDDIVTRKDGTIFVYDVETGNTVRINPDGSRKILVANRTRGEHFSIGLDLDENLYGNYGTGSFTRVDPDTGQLTPLPFVSSPCAFNIGGFVITDEGMVILIGDQLAWADLNTGGNGILIPNPAVTFAAEIGPDDALYIGTPGCGDQIPAQVVRMEDDGTRSVYLDGLRDTIDSIAFGQDGALYLATRDTIGNHLYYLAQPGDTLVEIPGAPQGSRLDLSVHPIRQTLFIAQKDGLPILEYDLGGQIAVYNFEGRSETRIEFFSDGTLFAYGSSGTDFARGYTDRWIYRMDLDRVRSEIIASIPRAEPGGTINTIAVDSEGMIWFYTNPDSKLYKVFPDGTVTLFAEHLPVDAPTVVVDDQGDIYFTSASGIFRIYREP